MPAAEHRHQHLFYNSLLAGQCLLNFPADRIQFLIHCSYILFGRFLYFNKRILPEQPRGEVVQAENFHYNE